MTLLQRKRRLAHLAARLDQLEAVLTEHRRKERWIQHRLAAIAAEISRVKLAHPQPEKSR